MTSVCQKAQANLAMVRETGSTWEFHIPRIDTWGYLARTPSWTLRRMAGSTASVVVVMMLPFALWKLKTVNFEKLPAIIEKVEQVIDGAVDCHTQV